MADPALLYHQPRLEETYSLELSRVAYVHKWCLLYVPTHWEFSCRLKDEKWMNVQVGDIIKLENNNFVTVSTVSLHPVPS